LRQYSFFTRHSRLPPYQWKSMWPEACSGPSWTLNWRASPYAPPSPPGGAKRLVKLHTGTTGCLSEPSSVAGNSDTTASTDVRPQWGQRRPSSRALFARKRSRLSIFKHAAPQKCFR